jgi:hypothetical protein
MHGPGALNAPPGPWTAPALLALWRFGHARGTNDAQHSRPPAQASTAIHGTRAAERYPHPHWGSAVKRSAESRLLPAALQTDRKCAAQSTPSAVEVNEGRSRLMQTLLGGTAEKVRGHATCPVLIIPERRQNIGAGGNARRLD